MMNSTIFGVSVKSTLSPVVITNSTHWWIPQVEIPYLLALFLVGVIGNVSIIGAIVLEKKLKFIGNAFIVNLAVADLIVTAYVVPGVLANVVANKNLFSVGMCSFTALVVSLSCLSSMYSLMFVALNRFTAIVYVNRYHNIFTKKKVGMFIIMIWMWSFILSIPPAFGWGDYRYHVKIHVCMYDCDTKFIGYTTTFIVLSIFLPFAITCLCYIGLFRVFRNNRARRETLINTVPMSTVPSTCTTNGVEPDAKRKKSVALMKREDNERRLVITLFSAVCLFTVCWVPYALIILINHNAYAIFKRSAVWLAFTNSAMNSILYGALNRNFRNGYKKLWSPLFRRCCKKEISLRTNDTSTSPICDSEYSTKKTDYKVHTNA